MHSGVFSTTLIQVLTIFQALEDNEGKPGAGGGMVQWIKHSLRKHENPSVDPQHPQTCQTGVAITCNHSTGEAETGDSLGQAGELDFQN